MISNYKIKYINGEEVLYLYFDFNYEFSIFNLKGKNKKIEDSIKEFIQRNKIPFKGVTILLISGGIFFGKLDLTSKTYENILKDNPIIYEEKINIENETSEVIEENQQEEKEEQAETKSIIEDISKNESNITIENEKEVPTIKTNFSKEDPIIIQEEIPQENTTQMEEAVDNNLYVNIKRANGITTTIELEEYIIGVVGAEMPASFQEEALKSQAIIARTYALKAISQGKTLTDNESTQSYKSNDQLQEIWGNSYSMYYNKIKNAVTSTKGAYLTYNGTYIEAVYHSTSNGKTENAFNVWKNYYPYLISVESPYDIDNPSFEMTKDISYNELSQKLGININIDTEYSILEYTESGRVASIMIAGNSYTGVQFRNILGLRSTDFELIKTDTGITFKTKGYGHGVGLSQYGANGMAKKGYSYEEILNHYYQGVNINYR